MVSTQEKLPGPGNGHDIQLYSLGTPNGQKVTILLEELGIEYDAYHVNIMKGDQFSREFMDVCPNAHIPCMVDKSVAGVPARDSHTVGGLSFGRLGLGSIDAFCGASFLESDCRDLQL